MFRKFSFQFDQSSANVSACNLKKKVIFFHYIMDFFPHSSTVGESGCSQCLVIVFLPAEIKILNRNLLKCQMLVKKKEKRKRSGMIIFQLCFSFIWRVNACKCILFEWCKAQVLQENMTLYLNMCTTAGRSLWFGPKL